MGVLIDWKGDEFIVEDEASLQAMLKSCFGVKEKHRVKLFPEEVLYLMEVRNAKCMRNGRAVSFNQVAKNFRKPKFLARYFALKDWRDRTLVIRPIDEAGGNYKKNKVVKYPAKKVEFPDLSSVKGLFFFDDFMAIIDDNEIGQELYSKYWFGQYGTYKAQKHGQFLKLDAYETLFLMRHSNLKLNIQEKRLIKEATKRREDFLALYNVYEDWRLKGFVLKTGFKFGTHFRVYFPGARPTLENKQWIHSKHVVHVFPRDSKMLISEWSRAVRVAHGVKKTFILAIPGKKRESKYGLDFLLYFRRHGVPQKPGEAKPKWVMLALSEEEEIGGQDLARVLEKAYKMGLNLMLAICDRETSVTYYEVKRIDLPESKYEYYEIEWRQP